MFREYMEDASFMQLISSNRQSLVHFPYAAAISGSQMTPPSVWGPPNLVFTNDFALQSCQIRIDSQDTISGTLALRGRDLYDNPSVIAVSKKKQGKVLLSSALHIFISFCLWQFLWGPNKRWSQYCLWAYPTYKYGKAWLVTEFDIDTYHNSVCSHKMFEATSSNVVPNHLGFS